MIGSTKPLTSTTDKIGYTLKKQNGASRELLDTPEVINVFNTGYENLRGVLFYNKQEIWTSAEVNKIKCFNDKGMLTNAIKTKSGEWPHDVSVTHDGCLLYSDWILRTVYKVVNGQIYEIIKPRKCIPGEMCITSCSNLLIVMYDCDKTQCKVVRYSGSTKKQTIQYEENGNPLYSTVDKVKYITENRNLDICVTDCAASAVVIVNEFGKLRFRYTGHPFKSKTNPFVPRGIRY